MLCEHLIKNHDNVRRSESLTNKLARSNRTFLQKIRTINSKNTSLPSSIEGHVTEVYLGNIGPTISELWISHVVRLLN